MPLYEFRCQSCKRRTTVFTRSIGAPQSPTCEHCGSTALTRLISRVAVLRSEEDIMSSAMDESSLAGVDENDPRSWARWIRRMSRQMGEPLDPQIEADLERMEAGEPLEEPEETDEAEDAFAEE